MWDQKANEGKGLLVPIAPLHNHNRTKFTSASTSLLKDAMTLSIEKDFFRAVGTWKPTRALTSIVCARASETSGTCIRTDVDGDMLMMDDYMVTSWNSRGLRARLLTPASTEFIEVDFETKSVIRTISPNGKEAFVLTLGE